MHSTSSTYFQAERESEVERESRRQRNEDRETGRQRSYFSDLIGMKLQAGPATQFIGQNKMGKTAVKDTKHLFTSFSGLSQLFIMVLKKFAV